ncbi:tRNA dihydrouridine(20/20a) synthase DusA [Pseudohongiella spirulinae]|uniref:tRNA-dihydrouridine(20/20a) synthase n=1 Tax=Pseudohongiella spirulinae TaxID=1249552 RepID=A0A0S2KCV0_9GAMM|nr:tRNA dihydrouridine(20/20a) synthase DusA [Pseudohongiella spirulinae]ALO46140.1 tRNA-dihydrouridine synthase [Pseudohongiella spirulinae]
MLTLYPNRRFSVAPMLDWTDRHERYFLRLLSRHALLYTEMVTSGAIIHGDVARHLAFDPAEHPVALQLGGSEPPDMARAAEAGQQYGYDEININVGCPSDRVQSGRFGACLMAEPKRVADCIKAMREVSDLPITVKSRVGIDEHDSDEFLQQFIETVASAGCSTFVLHARIALLQGLSPKENRDIPPLQYERVYRMKRRYPELEIIINGGIRTLPECQEHLRHTDGVMLGREIYQNPYFLAHIDRALYDAQAPIPERTEILAAYLTYVRQQLSEGASLQHLTRHILGIYKGEPGGRLFRRHLSEHAHRKQATASVLEDAIALAEHARMKKQNEVNDNVRHDTAVF